MKLVPSLLATSVLVLSVLGGCAEGPQHESVAVPNIKITPDSHTISAGTTTRVVANTVNVVGGSNIHWMATPTVATITQDGTHGTTALFTSNQEGTYVVKAWIDLGNGHIISDETNIKVNGIDANGRPVSDNR